MLQLPVLSSAAVYCRGASVVIRPRRIVSDPRRRGSRPQIEPSDRRVDRRRVFRFERSYHEAVRTIELCGACLPGQGRSRRWGNASPMFTLTSQHPEHLWSRPRSETELLLAAATAITQPWRAPVTGITATGVQGHFRRREDPRTTGVIGAGMDAREARRRAGPAEIVASRRSRDGRRRRSATGREVGAGDRPHSGGAGSAVGWELAAAHPSRQGHRRHPKPTSGVGQVRRAS